jgi:hypothetical protein
MWRLVMVGHCIHRRRSAADILLRAHSRRQRGVTVVVIVANPIFAVDAQTA